MADDAFPAAQVYVTHCLATDSVQGKAGFQARATSTENVVLQDFARDRFFYELPAELKRNDNTTPEAAPCRLSLVPVNNELSTWALVHSVLKLGDTRGRKYSFFTHVLFLKRPLLLRDALRCWGSPDWRNDYLPGQSKTLDPLPRPAAGPLSDRLVTQFLRGELREEKPLSMLIGPSRLSADPAERQQLMRRVLQGVRQGKRFYLVAEAGLVALLLYAVGRLLPEAREQPISFTTYEANNLALREYQLAQVIGVHGSDTGPRLDRDYFTTFGIALDTFNDSASECLHEPLPPLVERTLQAAVNDQWTQLDVACNRAAARSPGTPLTLQSFDDAWAVEGHLQRLGEGVISDTELLHLTEYPDVRQAFTDKARLRSKVAAVLPHLSLHQAHLRTGLFREILQENLGVLIQQAATAIRDSDSAAWLPHWQRIDGLVDDAGAKLAVFARMMETVDTMGGSIAPTTRVELMLTWVKLGGTLSNPPLLPTSSAEVTALMTRGLGHTDRIEVLFHALNHPATVETARGIVLARQDVQLEKLFIQRLQAMTEAERAALVNVLVQPDRADCRPMLELLLAGRVPMAGDHLSELLHRAEAYAPTWATSWGEQGMLGHLLGSYPKTDRHVAGILCRVAGLIGPEFVACDDPSQTRIHQLINDVCHELESPQKEHLSILVLYWSRLRDHVRGAREPQYHEQLWQEVQEIRRNLKFDVPRLLRLLAGQYRQDVKITNPEVRLLASLLLFLPPTDDLDEGRIAARQWLKLMTEAPERRAPADAIMLQSLISDDDVRQTVATELIEAGQISAAVMQELSSSEQQPVEQEAEEDEPPVTPRRRAVLLWCGVAVLVIVAVTLVLRFV